MNEHNKQVYMFLNYSKSNYFNFPLITPSINRTDNNSSIKYSKFHVKKGTITHLVLGNFLTHFLQVTFGKDQTHISLIQKYPAKTVYLFIKH